MNGIFAFGIWESRKRRMFLARDRIGVKPLFYSLSGEGLLFASEIKTILVHPSQRAALDAEGAAQILLLGPGRQPGSGVFRGIRELEPGCWATFEGGVLAVRRYWSLKDREHRENFRQTAEHTRAQRGLRQKNGTVREAIDDLFRWVSGERQVFPGREIPTDFR